MVCYHPQQAFYTGERTSTGKMALTFNRAKGYSDKEIKLACGRCIGCRLEYSKQWAIRCVHEAQLHEDNQFITLTYNDRHLPRDYGLHYEHFQAFMKRLRKELGNGIRFYMCGEYGDETSRPHYHALLFNCDLPDRRLHTIRRGNRHYTSETLTRLWGKGHCYTSDVTWQSAAYCARYVTKKITGQGADDHYRWVDKTSGEIHDRAPEFGKMSLRPGIGTQWLEKFKTDVYPCDFVVMNGRKYKPPKAYDKWLEKHDPELLKRLKIQRVRKGKALCENSTPDRLRVREAVQLDSYTRLRRE